LTKFEYKLFCQRISSFEISTRWQRRLEKFHCKEFKTKKTKATKVNAVDDITVVQVQNTHMNIFYLGEDLDNNTISSLLCWRSQTDSNAGYTIRELSLILKNEFDSDHKICVHIFVKITHLVCTIKIMFGEEHRHLIKSLYSYWGSGLLYVKPSPLYW